MRPKLYIIMLVIAVAALTAAVTIRYAQKSNDPVSVQGTVQSNGSSMGGVLPSDEVSDATVAAVLTTDSSGLLERHQHLRQISNRLSQGDRLKLLHSIDNEVPNGLNPGEWHSLANDIMQALRRQQPFMPEYTDYLVDLWLDGEVDPTLRDYALQHLREWVADGDSRTAHEERPEKIALILRTFLEAVTPDHPTFDPQSTSLGTALLALDEWIPRESGESPATPSSIAGDSDAPPSQADRVTTSLGFATTAVTSLTSEEFEGLLLTHATNPDMHRGIRSTALQLCARRGVEEALSAARGILTDAESDVILRIAAISLIGELGNSTDLSLLDEFQKQHPHDPLFQSSLHKAKQTLSSN